MLAASKAHLGGTAVTRVLIAPSAEAVLTAGEDGTLRLWAVPPAARQKSLAEREVRGFGGWAVCSTEQAGSWQQARHENLMNKIPCFAAPPPVPCPRGWAAPW